MAVFEYTAQGADNRQYHEHGTVVARDRIDAYDKIRRSNLINVNLRRLEGLSAWWAARRADIK